VAKKVYNNLIVKLGALVLGCATLAAVITKLGHQAGVEDPNTVWYIEEKTNAIMEQIINSPVMQRLKKVDQSGPPHYVGPKIPAFSRYDHSIGVWKLLKKHGASEIEQIAGLLHDVSHTAFSHLGDYLFVKKKEGYIDEDHQDSIHLAYIREKAGDLLKKHNIKIEDVDPNNGKHLMLEQSLPDMCADRIQYNVHTGIIFGYITCKEGRQIIDDLRFENGKWFFSNPVLAKKFAQLSLRFTKEFWGSQWNVQMNIIFGQAVKRAQEIGLISEADIFSTDDVIMDKLLNSSDEIIQQRLSICSNLTESPSKDKITSTKHRPKFRGIDPLIKVSGKDGLVRLTEIDSEFQEMYNDIQNWCKQGYNIVIESEK
jgi:hypothetical protein